MLGTPPCPPPQVDALDLYTIGPQFETDAAFPARTNTEFVEARVVCSQRCVVR